MNALLELRRVSRHYPVRLKGWRRGSIQALNEVSFSLARGRTLGVVGESGSGKSTLARQVAHIETPTAGRIFLDGEDVTGAGAPRRRRIHCHVRMIFQDPFGSLNPRARVRDLLEEPLVNFTDQGRKERRRNVGDMLEKVGLSAGSQGRYPHMFSGGQRQRVAIARALMLSPRVVVADEPVSALDVSIQAQILNLLTDLQAELNLSYIFISHDLGVVRHVADDLLVLYLGHVMEQGPAAQVLSTPGHPYTRALLASTPHIGGSRGDRPRALLEGELPSALTPPPGCVFHGRCRHATERCRREVPALRASGMSEVACHYAGELPEGHHP